MLSGKTELPQKEKKREPLKVMFCLPWVLITQQKVGKHGLNGKEDSLESGEHAIRWHFYPSTRYLG